MKKVTGYRCEHCGKVFLTERGCMNHEKSRCSRDPNRIPFCYECEHYEAAFGDDKDNIEFVVGTSWYGEDVTEYKKFEPNRCRLRKCKLYNNIKLSAELQDALDDNGYEPMPTPMTGGCKNFKQRG